MALALALALALTLALALGIARRKGEGVCWVWAVAWSWPGLRPAAAAADFGLGLAVTAHTRNTTPVSYASWPLGDCGCACGWGSFTLATLTVVAVLRMDILTMDLLSIAGGPGLVTGLLWRCIRWLCVL